MLDLSIIIVSYNTKEFLKNCLLSIKNNVSSKINYETIVVDNKSQDETLKMLPGFRSIIVIKNNNNLGFSKANNIAVAKSSGKYILFLNSDTLVSKNTIETMVRFMDQHPDAGVATCRVNLANGGIDDASHRGFPTPIRSFFYFTGISGLLPQSVFFNGYHLGYRDLDKTHEIEACAGAFMMVRRKAGDEIGWWDEDYFFYGEDLDFCYRVKKKNWKIYYVPTVSILHYKGVSGGIKKISKGITTASKDTKMRSLKARFDAMRIFYKKHYSNKYPSLLTWFVLKGIDFKFWLANKTL